MALWNGDGADWESYITIEDLYVAYRKAKAECFFDKVVPTAIKFAEYEKDINKNLRNLFKKLSSSNHKWTTDLSFIGNYSYIPKSIDLSRWESENKVIHYRATDPVKDWKLRFEENNNKVKANYRLIIDAEVDFHIVSALWVLKVGHLFEKKLDKKLSYGNRLRRYAKSPFSEPGELGELNKNSPGLFQPYFSAYQAWRQNGLNSMRSSVESGDSIYAITMDITSFFHNADPSFILHPDFLESINVELSEHDIDFTHHLLTAITTWYESTPDYENRIEGAIPVGLSASKILSNILLESLDRQMGKELNPVYYGRYVDDIFLVIKQPENCNSGSRVLKYLVEKVPCLEKDDDNSLRLQFKYAPNSDLYFKPDKQKIFLLDSEHGLDLIDQIENQIKRQSSEYRLLPDLPDSSSEMAKKALLATPDAKLEADALRKADGVSIRRLGFSLLFKDINSYAQDLNPESWSEIRQEFYGLVERHLLCPTGLFDFQGFLPRILSLLISCNDFGSAKKFLEKVSFTLQLIQDTSSANINNGHSLFTQHLQKFLKESAFQASTVKGFSKWEELTEVLREIENLYQSNTEYSVKALQDTALLFLTSDLGVRSYKDYWYYEQKSNIARRGEPKNEAVRSILRLDTLSKFQKRSKLNVPFWNALAFPTRPLSIQEIVVICPDVLKDYKLFRLAVMAIRGAGTSEVDNVGFINKKSGDIEHLFALSPPRRDSEVRIALTNIETTPSQWTGAAKGTPDRSLKRYQNFNDLLNKILKDKGRPNYVVFPELSVPRKWAFGLARKLASNSISMIAGLEYYPCASDKTKLHNDSMISLVTRWPGYLSNVVLFQPKLKPSHGERKGLTGLKKEQVEPQGGVSNFPIFAHGDFFFGVLICSDLTNMQNRLHFQGNVDGLFVLEWNRDVKTFSFLVESAAHDVHTNVIQVNNRLYGDSRIRSPKDKDYERDNVRVKGGISDYYVIGEIEFDRLRKFQSEHLQTNGDVKDKELKGSYKPLPIGFRMSTKRAR